MPSRRLFLICTGLSVLLHLLILWLAYHFPSGAPPQEKVITVDLADLPRSTDFRPPRPGILEGRRPRRPPPAVREKAPKPPPAEVMEGRVPNLPVNPELPPEKAFQSPRAKQEPPVEAKSPGPQARPGPPGPEASARPEPPSGAQGGEAPGERPMTMRDLTPSLGKMVMARRETSGGRGTGTASGDAVGTGGKTSGKEGVTEEGGSGFHLTPLNAPEVQYISYFASIKRKIELVWQYPYDAAIAGVQGECTIDFVIGRSGKLESVELVRGSGYKVLDDEAVRSVRKASPFDPIPANYDIPNLPIRGRFVYVHGGALRVH
jgi:TonB family protein